MGWRETKAQAREIVHETMKVPAILLASLAAADDSNGQNPVNVRIHNKETRAGDQPGTSLNSAEIYDPIPKAIFWRPELAELNVTLTRNMVISVAAGEGYNIDVVHPHDGETITCDITRLDAEDAASLPVPE